MTFTSAVEYAMSARKRKNIVLANCFFPIKNYLNQGILSKYIQGAYEIYFGYIHLFIFDKEQL